MGVRLARCTAANHTATPGSSYSFGSPCSAANTPLIRYLVPEAAYVAGNGTNGEVAVSCGCSDWSSANRSCLSICLLSYPPQTVRLSLQGANRPSPREITLKLTNNPYFKRSSKYNTSYLLSALGQSVCKQINRATRADPQQQMSCIRQIL